MATLPFENGVRPNYDPTGKTQLIGPDLSPILESATVHLVEFEPELAPRVSNLLSRLGVSTKIHRDRHHVLHSDTHAKPGCVLLRTRCSPAALLDSLADLGVGKVGMPVVLAADRSDARTAVAAMKAGVTDFVEQPFNDRDLLDAVVEAVVIDSRRRRGEARRRDVCRRFQTLTPREQQVMSLVTTGLLNKQVAGNLGLSEITVKAHRGSAMRKMAARTIADLVRMADLLAATPGADTCLFRDR